MKHYSQFLLQNKVQKEIDMHIQRMFQRSLKQDEYYIQFSGTYGQIQRVLIECIESYVPSINKIFDHESVVEFVKIIDQIAKEKATQVIQHFINQSKLEKYVLLGQSWEDTSDCLNEQQEMEVDSICEQCVLFSQYY